MTRPVPPRRRRIRRAAVIVAVGAAALPAAAFGIPSISGADGVVINPAAQSPDLTVDGVGTIFWSIQNTDLFGANEAPVKIDVDGLADGTYTLDASDFDGPSSRTFTVDGTAPTGGSLGAPAVTKSADIAVTASASSDSTGPVTYGIGQDGAPPAAYGALPTGYTIAGGDGTKQLALWARDGVGNAQAVATASVVLDRGGPVIAIGSPDDGATYSLGAVKTAAYSCTDAVDGSPSCTGTVANGGAIDTGTPGPKSFTVTATDDAGNTSSKTVEYTVADNAKPTIAITTPRAQRYEIHTTHVADFSCDDNGTVTACAAAVDGVALKDGDPINTATLGEHTFTVRATDDAGNTETKQVTYEVVDTNDPDPAGLVSPPDNTVTNQLRPRLNWTAASDPGPGGAPGSGIGAYQVVLDGDVVATLASNVTSWTPGEDLKTGQHTWRVRAIDMAGNPKLSGIFNFKVDPNATPAPAITTAPPAATNDNTPSFAWTGADGVQEYRWTLRQGTATVDDGTVSGGSSSVDLGALKDGAYVFTVTQRTNGNHGTAAAHAFTVDTVAPGQLTIVLRPAGASDDPTPLFAWSGGEANARYIWQLTGPGGVIVQGPNETPLNAALLTVAGGSYVFQVRQMDAAGNPGPLTIPEPFTVVGNTPPPPPTDTVKEPTTPPPTIGKKPTRTVKDARPAPTVRNARALTPKAGARITSVRPVLRWKSRRGASLYNVQVFRLKGTKLTKVVTAFPRATHYRVPKGKLKAGFRYVWRVWPYVNQRFPSQPLGVSYFDVRQTAKALARGRLLAPAAATLSAGRPLTVRWRAKSGSVAYKVQVLRGAEVAFERITGERTVVVPASALSARGTVRIRVLPGLRGTDTTFAAGAWAQADLRIR